VLLLSVWGESLPAGFKGLSVEWSFVRMWARAQRGEAFFATAENHNCLTGEYHLGLRDEAVKE